MLSASHPGTLGTPGQSDEGRTDGSTVARTPDCTSPESPRRMAIHAVRYGEEETLSPRATTDPYGQDEGVDPRTTRTGSEPESDLEVQSPEAAIHQPAESTNLPVAAAGDRTQQPVVGAAPFSQSLRSLALAVLPGPTTPIEIQPLGRTIGPPVARTIEKSAAARACLTLRLQNDGVVCYVNANLSAFLWGMLQRQSADWADFSGQEKAFQSLLTKGQYNAFALETPGFEGLTGAWGSFHRQEDGHEFTHTLLSWCRPACMDLTWSRRYVAKGNVLTYDHGSTDMPPTLTVGACEKGASSLQRLITAWNNHCGMKTCFHHAHELLCLHLDRLTRNDSGEVCRAAWQIEIEAEVVVPFWMTDDNMAPFSQEYVPVAVIFHNGSIHSGHLRTALKTSQGWFTTEDGQVAVLDTTNLQAIGTDIAHVWLVRSDAYHAVPLAEPLMYKDDSVLKAIWYIHHEKYRDFKQDDQLLHVLRSSCADCGAPCFGAEGLHHHMEERHPGLLLGLRQIYNDLILDLNEVNIPCGLCLAKFHPRIHTSMDDRVHCCPVVLNLALAKQYYYSALAPLGSRYRIPPADDPTMQSATRQIPVSDIIPEGANDPVGTFLDALMR